MNADLAELEKLAYALPADERAKLALGLLESLDESSLDTDLIGTVQRRAAELESGQVQAVPAEEVFRKARALLDK